MQGLYYLSRFQLHLHPFPKTFLASKELDLRSSDYRAYALTTKRYSQRFRNRRILWTD